MARHLSRDEISVLRSTPLDTVARALGYQRSTRDKARWKRPGSIVSINGQKFFDHLTGTGGGGAIDLVIHAEGASFAGALMRLETIAGSRPSPWHTVRRWLIRHRGLNPGLVDACHARAIIKADAHTNAVFVTRNARRQHTGAEIVGTNPERPFRGMARGSRKNQGGFWLARRTPQSALLTESAVDLLSACSIDSLGDIDLFISTAGIVASLPAWLNPFPLDTVFCGYDADEAGDSAARRLMCNHPDFVKRRKPEGAKDWNDMIRKAAP